MQTQYPMRQVPCVGAALALAILVTCGCSPAAPAPESDAVDSMDAASGDDSPGLPTKGEDSGVGDKDAGLGTKDAGLGTEDAGLGTEDAGETADAGPGMQDAGPRPEDAGMTGTADAGGMDECFACAEARCAVPVNACLHSSACVEEGDCDLACLTGSASAPNPRCVQSCTKDPLATQELLAAVTCGFAVCPKECLHVLISCGGDAGAFGGEEPGSGLGCLTGRTGVAPHY
jgi:hypothetical protein